MQQFVGLKSMFAKCSLAGWRAAPVAASLLAAYPSLALAQDSTPPGGSAPSVEESAKDAPSKRPTVSRKKATSPNVTINLLNLLVQQGVLTDDQAKKLIKQAEDEAYVSQQAARDASAKAAEASRAATAAAAAAAPPGSKHVVYVPEFVKKQLRDDLKKEVMAEAKAENWASPGAYPEWASRVTIYGDLRTRYEGGFFPKGGYNSPGGIVNFNSINTGSPYDVSTLNQAFPPAYNNTTNMTEFEIQARLGANINVWDGLTAGIRFATGNSPSPISTNQVLGGGTANNFSIYAAWLDRAFLRYQPNQPYGDIAILAGRFDNPFFTATDLMWYRDIAFDGAAVQARREIMPGLAPFVVAGAFPIFNTNLNVGTTQVQSVPSENRYLFGGQVGVKWNPYPDYEVTAGVSYFDFSNVQGKLSAPCDITLTNFCSTDNLRPMYAQKGNTYMALRNIVPPATYTGGDYSQPQYFGLASAFRPVDFNARLDFSQFNPIHVIVDGEYVVNTAFNYGAVSAVAVNNLRGTTDGSTGTFSGGNTGWMARLTVGYPTFTKFGDWNLTAGYKYLQSDAVLDAFVDPDFGLGGTNLKGYVIGGSFAFSPNVWARLRWLSATNISGTPYAVDVVQLDLNAKF